MTRRNAPTAVGLLPVVLLTLVGCAGESDDESDSPGAGASASEHSGSAAPSSDPAGSAPTQEATEVGPADQAIADAALLTLQDFPPGWEAAPADDTEDEESQREIAECVGVDYEDLYGDQFAEAESPDFTSENDEEVSNMVSLAVDEQQAADSFEIAARPEFSECVVDSLTASVEEDDDVEVGEITINQLSFGSYGDQTLAFRMTIPLSAEGISIEATGDVVIVRIGRATTQVRSFGVGSSLSADDLARYVDVAVRRLTEELAQSD